MSILFGRNQLPVFVSFIICGVISGAFYDILRIKRRIFSDRLIFLFVDDLLFFVFCTMLVVFNAYSFNDGNMKWYEIPLMIFGFAVYRRTLSVVFIGVCFYLIDCMNKLIAFLLRPVKLLISFSINLYKKLSERVVLMLYSMHMSRKFVKWRFYKERM